MDTYEPTKKKSPFADSPYECAWAAPAAPAQSEGAIPQPEGVAFQPEVTPPQPTAPQKPVRRGMRPIIAILLAVACTIGATVGTSALWQGKMDRMEAAMDDKFNVLTEKYDEIRRQESTVPSAPSTALTPSQVYSRNVAALVSVFARYETAEGYGQSAGSGFIISADGYIVTNFHVVEGATSVSVTTNSNKNYIATVIGYDSANDVALLKIDGKNLPYAVMGSSEKVSVGDQVAVIGNPLGELTATLTVGYISAKDRVLNGDGTSINMLQTDAAINSGNSGGPMFNMYGEVIGIITAKFSGDSGAGATIEGLGFAIPIDDVAGILSDLKEFGYVTGAYLGVYVRDVDVYGQSYGLPAGAYVDEAVPGYCAAKAGIRAGDIIINIGGHDVKSLNDLTRVLRRFKAGDTTSVTVYRNGRREYLTITFDEKPAPQTEQTEPAPSPDDSVDGTKEWWEYFLFPFLG